MGKERCKIEDYPARLTVPASERVSSDIRQEKAFRDERAFAKNGGKREKQV